MSIKIVLHNLTFSLFANHLVRNRRKIRGNKWKSKFFMWYITCKAFLLTAICQNIPIPYLLYLSAMMRLQTVSSGVMYNPNSSVFVWTGPNHQLYNNSVPAVYTNFQQQVMCWYVLQIHNPHCMTPAHNTVLKCTATLLP